MFSFIANIKEKIKEDRRKEGRRKKKNYLLVIHTNPTMKIEPHVRVSV